MKNMAVFNPYAGYGARFGNWVDGDDREPYNSFGNGSAMRVSPLCLDHGLWLLCKITGIGPIRNLKRISAEVTHNHPEGVSELWRRSDAIFLCRIGGYSYRITYVDHPTECKRIKEYIEKEYGYTNHSDDIRPNYHFKETCQDTVPQAIIAFLESTDFEDAIRNAISLVGDSTWPPSPGVSRGRIYPWD